MANSRRPSLSSTATARPLGAWSTAVVKVASNSRSPTTTRSRRPSATLLVTDQAKARKPLVIYVSQGQCAYYGILPLVFDVTILTFVGARQESVQGDTLILLSDYLDVALFAAAGADAIKGCVTAFALIVELGVRVKASQRFAA